jgi:hypothetical protein
MIVLARGIIGLVRIVGMIGFVLILVLRLVDP